MRGLLSRFHNLQQKHCPRPVCRQTRETLMPMSLMAIILWALNALSPWRRYYEATRHFLQVIIRNLGDEATLRWLCLNPDDPEGVPLIERAIHDLHAGIDLLIYVRACGIVGRRPGKWARPCRSPLQPRRTRTMEELFTRADACAGRFNDLERLARRRA